MMKDYHLLCCLLSLLSQAVLLLCGCFKATDIILYGQVRRVIDWDAVMGRPIAGGEHWLTRGIKNRHFVSVGKTFSSITGPVVNLEVEPATDLSTRFVR